MFKIENLKVAYGQVEVIHEVSIEVKQGSVVSLIGSNGAGKTTILKTISGLMKPLEGSIMLEGKEISTLKPYEIAKLGIAHSLEGRQIYPKMTVEENLFMGAYLLSDKNKVNDLLKQVYELFPRLKERREQKGGTLSGGEAQMLAMSRTIMMDPKIILLDEPSLGLAPVIVTQIFSIVRQLKEIGKTILLVEQNVPMALNSSDYGYVLQTGRVTIEGTAESLKSNNEVQKAYLGI